LAFVLTAPPGEVVGQNAIAARTALPRRVGFMSTPPRGDPLRKVGSEPITARVSLIIVSGYFQSKERGILPIPAVGASAASAIFDRRGLATRVGIGYLQELDNVARDG
jgi:hypothetical protein